MFTCTQCGRAFTPRHVKRGHVPPFCGLKCFGQSLRDKVKDRTEKKCCRCKIVMPLTSFSRDARKPDGRAGWCKECCYLHRTTTGVAAMERYEASDKGRASHRKSLQILRSDPAKYAAHNAVSAAVFGGRLTAMPCEVCGAARTVAHHDDYTRPLDVRWLCQRHHMALHAKLRKERQ